MEQLIFIGLIILFSIIESISRKRKQQSGQPQLPEEWEPTEWKPVEPRRERRPDRARQSSTTTREGARSHGEITVDEPTPSRRTMRSGSEAMIPTELWEEIAGRARGGLETKPAPPEPAPPPPVAAPKVPPSTASARAAWGRRTPRVGQHRPHTAQAEYGTDPSSRTPSPHDIIDPLARKLSADVRAVRRQIRGGRHALRQAVILQEVLGPPASMRPEAFLE
jgi:hypothetical protein